MAHQAGAYRGFCSMKRLEVVSIITPPGWDAIPSQGYPSIKFTTTPLMHQGREKHCESKMSCSRTQCNVACLDSNLDNLIWRRAHLHNSIKKPSICMHVYKDLIRCKSVCDVHPRIDPYPLLARSCNR